MRFIAWLADEEQTPLFWGITFLFFAHIADVLSTLFATHRAGLLEGNPLLRDPETSRFLLLTALTLKAAQMIFLCAPISFFVYKATRNAVAASLIFFWFAIPTVQVAFFNVVLALSR